MTLRTVRRHDAELATEAFGKPSDPALLLIMGAMASMLWWPEEFCRCLAGEGHYVIRYDNRDTGLSTVWPPGEPGYSSDDMVDDAVAILDAYGIETAHVAGMSMGGMLAQKVALRHPARVRTLTAISTSPIGISGLPPASDSYREHAAGGEAVDWKDRASVIDFMTRDAAALASTMHPHDSVAARAMIERDFDRARSFASATNHFMLPDQGEPDARTARQIPVSLLVIHGTSDPIFPIEHGEALAAAVAGATLVRIEGGGHELHRNDWPQIIAATSIHMRSVSQ